MSDTVQPPFDVRDPAFLADPYPVFARMRATAPVWKAPMNRWFLTSYKDTDLLLRDRRFGRGYDDPDALMRRFGPTALDEPAVVELSHMMLMRDPPDHTRLRGLVTKAFTARRIEALRAQIQDMTDRLLDKLVPYRRMDAIRDLAFPLPVLVICELLGIPQADRAHFVTRSGSGGALLNPTPPTRAELRRRQRRRLPPVRRLFRRSVRTAAQAPAGRPDHPTGPGRGSRRSPQHRRTAGQRQPAVRRGPRNDGEPDRQRHPGAAAPPRPMGDVVRGPVPDP